MNETSLTILALARYADSQRAAARSRRYTGQAFADVRAKLRAEATQADLLADKLRTGQRLLVPVAAL